MEEEDAYGISIVLDPIIPADEVRIASSDMGALPGSVTFKNGKLRLTANKLSFKEPEPDPYSDNPAFGAF